jgi:hypothetical protein
MDQPPESRARLTMTGVFPTKFADTVRSVFAYLQRYSFEEAAADWRKVTYSRSGWTISVYFAPFEYEVSLSIAHAGRRFEISSFIEALDPDEFARTQVLTAESDEELRTSLASLSNRLQKFGARVLDGDTSIMEFVASAVEAADARRS